MTAATLGLLAALVILFLSRAALHQPGAGRVRMAHDVALATTAVALTVVLALTVWLALR